MLTIQNLYQMMLSKLNLTNLKKQLKLNRAMDQRTLVRSQAIQNSRDVQKGLHLHQLFPHAAQRKLDYYK